MFYVQFFVEQNVSKFLFANVLQEGCQQSVVKYHIFTFFWETSLSHFCILCSIQNYKFDCVLH